MVAYIRPKNCRVLDCMLILETVSDALIPSSDNVTQREDVGKLLIANKCARAVNCRTLG